MLREVSASGGIRSELERTVQERWSLSIRGHSKREAKNPSESLKKHF